MLGRELTPASKAAMPGAGSQPNCKPRPAQTTKEFCPRSSFNRYLAPIYSAAHRAREPRELDGELQNFDAEIAKTKQVVEEMRSKIEQSGIVLDTVAKTDKKIGDADFDIENARIEDVMKQQKVMEGNIADLIIGLEDATNVFGTEFESMKSFTGWETFVGIFSDESKQRMRTDRVRNMSLAGNLQELLSKSDTIVGILKAQKQVLDARYKTSEASLAQVIERRKATMANLTTVQKRIEELNPLLLDIENKIAASTSQKDRTQLEGERSKLATEYNEKQAKEQELLAESQTLERYTSMFQTFVDSLNNQIAAQNTLINKLTIDTEQRIVLYKALEDSLKTAAQQDVAHKINTLGTRSTTPPKRPWPASARPRRSTSAICSKCTRRTWSPPPTSSAARSSPTMPLRAASRRCCGSTMRRTTCSRKALPR